MLKKTRQIAAFTLLECLVSLLVLSGGLLVLDGLTRLFSRDIHYQESNQQKDWLLFSEQLRLELEGAEIIKVANNRLYVKKGEQKLAFGQSQSDDFRKTNENGKGYQPMIYQVAATDIQNKGDYIEIRLVFKSGLERSFIHGLEKKS